MDIVYEKIKSIMQAYQIEEEYALAVLTLYSNNSMSFSHEIEEFLDEKKEDKRLSKVLAELKGIKSIESLVFEREKNTAKIDYSIDEACLDICYETNGRLDLDYFNLDDFIFEDKFKKAISSSSRVIEIYSECRKEAFYYVLYLLQSEKDKVRIVDSKEKYHNYVPDNENIILVTNFSDVLEEERFPRCKVIRIHDRTVKPDDDSKNKIMLSPRRKGNIKSALLRVFGNDKGRVEELLDKTNGYYTLIEAELESVHKDYAWEKVKLCDKEFDNLEKFLFIESFDNKGKAFLSSIGFDADEILLSAEYIDYKDSKTDPFHSEREYEVFGDKRIEYKVNSPDKVWKYVRGIDKRLPDKYLEYAKRILEKRSVTDSGIYKNLIYSTIRHQRDIGINRVNTIIDMAFASLSDLSSSSKKDILPAITELSSSRMIEWLRANTQEINEENISTLFLLVNTEETAEEMIDLLIDKANAGELKTKGFHYCESISNLFVDIIHPYQKTTPLSVDKTIEKIESFKPVVFFKGVVRHVLPNRGGIALFSISERYKYRSFGEDYEKEYSQEDKKRIISTLFDWFISYSDLNDLIYLINNRAVLFFVSSEVFLSSFERITNGLTDDEKYPIYSAICDYEKEAKKDNYPEEIKSTLDRAEECVTPSSKMLKILPEITAICNRYRKNMNWETNEQAKENELFDLVSNNCIDRDDYLNSFSLMEGSLFKERALIKVFFKLYGYDDIDIRLISKFPPNAKNEFLFVLMDFNSDLFYKLLPCLSHDAIFSLVVSASYPKVKMILPYLSDEKQIEYWKKINVHCVLPKDKQDYIEIVRNSLNSENYSLSLDVLLFGIDLFSGKELFDLLKENKKHYYSPVNYEYEVDKVFSKIREASDRGEIPEKDVIGLEKQLLQPKDLCAKGSFYVRDFKRQPDIFASVFEKIYIKDHGKKLALSEEKLNYWHQLYLELIYCPESPIDGTDYDNGVLKWFDDFVILLEKQNQSSIADTGIARLLAYAPKSFDSIMPDKAAEVIEKYAKKYKHLLISLPIEISNRRGCFTFDDGVSSYNYSLTFQSYSRVMKEKGFKETATMYEALSQEFLARAKEERDQGEFI